MKVKTQTAGDRGLRRTRVLLADDHQMLADALKGVLEPRFEVVGIVRDGRALVEAAARLRPEIVVVDIAMPQLNGLDAARQIRHQMPNVKLVFMTMNEDPELVGEAFRAGASAFLLKQAAAFELIDAIEKVLKGGSYVTPRAAEGQAHIALREPRAREHAPEPTPRQREVIQLLAEGRSMKEVASILNITKRTVAAHKYAVMELLQLKTNADLVQYAIKHRIIAI
jgi:DNA-binding NarL/FixJ family response regulator